MKDELYERLQGNGIKYIDVDRNATVNGVPSFSIEVYAENDVRHEFTFAKHNAMSVKNMADVIKSYLRNRT